MLEILPLATVEWRVDLWSYVLHFWHALEQKADQLPHGISGACTCSDWSGVGRWLQLERSSEWCIQVFAVWFVCFTGGNPVTLVKNLMDTNICENRSGLRNPQDMIFVWFKWKIEKKKSKIYKGGHLLFVSVAWVQRRPPGVMSAFWLSTTLAVERNWSDLTECNL